MSTTSIETSLSSLLPTLNGNLPPELVHLATSLLAQSRVRISLKPNEEVARPYGCAEIACKRLHSRLKLPTTTHGRPPLPPKVYAKLLDLLEKGLQVTKAAKTKAVGGKQADDVAGSSPAKGLDGTPRKRGAVNGTGVGSKPAVTTAVPTTPSKKVAFAGTVSARKAAGRGDAEEEAPEWVMPLIRQLCAAFATPMLPPHVYTGTCVVLKLAGLWPRAEPVQEDVRREKILAMTVAIFFMVLTRMQIGKITPEVYLSRCEKALTVTREMGSGDLKKEAIDKWIKEMNDRAWCRGQDWWDSVPEDVMDLVDNGDAVGDLAEEDDLVGSKRKRTRVADNDQSEGDKEGVLLPGLGTMMQDAVDFLSEERTLDYLEWKKGILQRIKQWRREREQRGQLDDFHDRSLSTT